MDITSLLGLLIAFGCILAGYTMDNGQMAKLVQIPGLLIVLGGSIGAVCVSFPLKELKLLPQMFKNVFANQKINELDTINQIVHFSELARREGLLALEGELPNIKSPLMEKGIRLIIDGTESHSTKDIMSWDMYLVNDVYSRGAKIFAAAGGFSPTMGIIGTVMGLISVLGGDMSNPEELTKGIASAFIATLYGVSLANLVWLPFEAKVKAKAARERLINELVIEGVLSIQAGDHPNTVREKLNQSYFEKTAGKKGAPKEAAAPAAGEK
jgi:chemotaxis protein MotA